MQAINLHDVVMLALVKGEARKVYLGGAIRHRNLLSSHVN
jgi:hypothetical protein